MWPYPSSFFLQLSNMYCTPTREEINKKFPLMLRRKRGIISRTIRGTVLRDGFLQRPLAPDGIISGCGAAGSAGGLGPSGRRFEPCHSDHVVADCISFATAFFCLRRQPGGLRRPTFCANRKWGKSGKGARPLSTPYPRGGHGTPSSGPKACSRDPLSSRKRSYPQRNPTGEPTRNLSRRAGTAFVRSFRWQFRYVDKGLHNHGSDDGTRTLRRRRGGTHPQPETPVGAQCRDSYFLEESRLSGAVLGGERRPETERTCRGSPRGKAPWAALSPISGGTEMGPPEGVLAKSAYLRFPP